VILVLGGTGLLGQAFSAELSARGERATAPGRDELDLEVAGAAARFIAKHRPDAVLNAAGFTNVPACELDENKAAVERLNADLPAELATTCETHFIPLVHVSTDYVFDGAKEQPYREDDAVNPLQAYGTSKLKGERAVLQRQRHPRALVVRVSTLYGPGRPSRDAYVDAILRQARAHDARDVLAVVEKPISSPTYAPDVAPACLDLLNAGATGLVHVVNEGGVSRLELARAAVRLAGLADLVSVIPKPEPVTSLTRPAYSVLATDRLFELLGRRLPPWDDALRRYIGA
jgi:dTDP-4-dehydrorhamnose reductase